MSQLDSGHMFLGCRRCDSLVVRVTTSCLEVIGKISSPGVFTVFCREREYFKAENIFYSRP